MKRAEEFNKDTYLFNSKQFDNRIKRTLLYFDGKLNHKQNILDIGERNLLTDNLESKYDITIDSTSGDLDTDFSIPNKLYDVIIYSHTIEHQFNPLYTLLRIKRVLRRNGVLYILVPSRGKLLWDKGHYHEIDDYRMRILLKRSGFKVISRGRQKQIRDWKFYLTGIRPLLRLFFEYSSHYELKKL